MTTGRINQVTADKRGRAGGTGPARPVTMTAVGLVWIAAPESSVCVGQNASSHGFRTCPYRAPRRRQDPVRRMWLAWSGVPPIAGFAAPAQCWPRWIRTNWRRPPDMRGLVGSLCYRCGWFVPGGFRPRRWMCEGLEKPSIHTTQAGWGGRTQWGRPLMRGACQESGADAPRTRGRPGVSARVYFFNSNSPILRPRIRTRIL